MMLWQQAAEKSSTHAQHYAKSPTCGHVLAPQLEAAAPVMLPAQCVLGQSGFDAPAADPEQGCGR